MMFSKWSLFFKALIIDAHNIFESNIFLNKKLFKKIKVCQNLRTVVKEENA